FWHAIPSRYQRSGDLKRHWLPSPCSFDDLAEQYDVRSPRRRVMFLLPGGAASEKTVSQRTLWRSTASSGQSVPPSEQHFLLLGDAPGMFVTPLPAVEFPSFWQGQPPSRSGGNAFHLHGGRTGTSVDAAAFTGGSSRVRAQDRCALRFSGCIPAAFGFLAPAGSQCARPPVAAALRHTWR
ncbi:conserved hypothetical protein, partial [Trichinella spiralis]|uniref:hypothetical protein n=1 Tax=Trichinella spiralis TaxID=6334 RepID=UPI0001EFEDA5